MISPYNSKTVITFLPIIYKDNSGNIQQGYGKTPDHLRVTHEYQLHIDEQTKRGFELVSVQPINKIEMVSSNIPIAIIDGFYFFWKSSDSEKFVATTNPEDNYRWIEAFDCKVVNRYQSDKGPIMLIEVPEELGQVIEKYSSTNTVNNVSPLKIDSTQEESFPIVVAGSVVDINDKYGVEKPTIATMEDPTTQKPVLEKITDFRVHLKNSHDANQHKEANSQVKNNLPKKSNDLQMNEALDEVDDFAISPSHNHSVKTPMFPVQDDK